MNATIHWLSTASVHVPVSLNEYLYSPGSLSNLITMGRHNMVAISKVGNLLLAFLYPRFCPILFGVNSSRTHGSVRQGQGPSDVSKWQICITSIEVNHQILFPDQVCFSTSLLNLMYSSIFVRVAKNLALYPRFLLSIQHVSIVVHNLWKKCSRYFLFAMRFQ